MKIFSNNIKISMSSYILSSILISALLIFSSCENDNKYDYIKSFTKGEIVYPEMFDTIFTTRGYERVEIDLRRDGRIPSSQMNLSKARKMVVVYDEDSPSPTVIEIDSVCSYVDLRGLTEPRLYRIKVYTVDEKGNTSKFQETTVVPFTEYDKELLKQSILDPSTTTTPSSMIMEWPNGLNSIVMEYHGLSYEYMDNDGIVHTGSSHKSPRIFAANLPVSQEVIFNIKYKMLPILEDGTKLLDTLEIEKDFAIKLPTIDQEFIPQELAILRANGINNFTIRDVEGITSLTYPMNLTTFADLFYFPNITSINLTGIGLENTLEKLRYTAYGHTFEVGGGAWQYFMMPSQKPSEIRPPESLQTLKDLIDVGQITNIKYIPKSMGFEFDAFLEPYIESGVVELLTNDHPFFPNEVFMHPQFFGSAIVQAPHWEMLNAHSGDLFPLPNVYITKFDAKNDVVNGQPVDLKLDQLIESDGKNIYRGVIVGHGPGFMFALPREWRFDNQRYRYLKFKMFIGSDISLVSNVNGNNRHIFRAPWVRSLNRLWGFPHHSDYGISNWDSGRMTPMTDDEIQNSWREYTVDMMTNDGGDNSNYRNRVIIITPGHEDPVSWSYEKDKEVVIYLADIRFTKTP